MFVIITYLVAAGIFLFVRYILFTSFILISQNKGKAAVVTYRCPSNTAVQVYNYQRKTARVVFGPDLVMLDPHETFNVLFLSGKVGGNIKFSRSINLPCLVIQFVELWFIFQWLNSYIVSVRLQWVYIIVRH